MGAVCPLVTLRPSRPSPTHRSEGSTRTGHLDGGRSSPEAQSPFFAPSTLCIANVSTPPRMALAELFERRLRRSLAAGDTQGRSALGQHIDPQPFAAFGDDDARGVGFATARFPLPLRGGHGSHRSTSGGHVNKAARVPSRFGCGLRAALYHRHVPKKVEVWVQLATRVPASLLHRVKIRCVKREQTVMQFVAEALREKLRRVGGDKGDHER